MTLVSLRVDELNQPGARRRSFKFDVDVDVDVDADAVNGGIGANRPQWRYKSLVSLSHNHD